MIKIGKPVDHLDIDFKIKNQLCEYFDTWLRIYSIILI